MARGDVWMPFYGADYLNDTMHLTTLEHGAYLLLIWAAWVNDGRLPDDDGRLAAIAKLSPKVWGNVRPAVSEFFTLENGFWVQARVVREREKANRLSGIRSEVGSLGGRPPKSKPQSKTKPKGLAKRKQNETPLPSPLQPPLEGSELSDVKTLNRGDSPSRTVPDSGFSEYPQDRDDAAAGIKIGEDTLADLLEHYQHARDIGDVPTVEAESWPIGSHVLDILDRKPEKYGRTCVAEMRNKKQATAAEIITAACRVWFFSGEVRNAKALFVNIIGQLIEERAKADAGEAERANTAQRATWRRNYDSMLQADGRARLIADWLNTGRWDAKEYGPPPCTREAYVSALAVEEAAKDAGARLITADGFDRLAGLPVHDQVRHAARAAAKLYRNPVN